MTCGPSKALQIFKIQASHFLLHPAYSEMVNYILNYILNNSDDDNNDDDNDDNNRKCCGI